MVDQKIYLQHSILPVGGTGEAPAGSRGTVQPGVPFRQVLQQEISGVKFSQHAQQRLKARSIQLSAQQMQKINGGLEKVSQKGARESLMVMGDLAMIVNIPNKTIITVMDGQSMKENVFTNIDSAIIL